MSTEFSYNYPIDNPDDNPDVKEFNKFYIFFVCTLIDSYKGNLSNEEFTNIINDYIDNEYSINNTQNNTDNPIFTSSSHFDFVSDLSNIMEHNYSHEITNNMPHNIPHSMPQDISHNNCNNNILSDDEPECYICGDIIYSNGSSQYKLNCGHVFHYDCIQMSITTKNTSPYGYTQSSVCPYCRKKCNFNNFDHCSATIQSGKNKGKKCQNRSTCGKYCGKHKKFNVSQ